MIRLWEQPTNIFLNKTGLLAFAALTQTETPDLVLTQVSQQIQKISDRRVQNNITGCSAILAGLVLKQESINRILREEIMQESVIYQQILQKGIEQGIKQGIERIALNLLRGGIEATKVAEVTELPLQKITNLQKKLERFS